jgi:hypothetical protein
LPGVDYLGLVLAAHDAETLGQLAFRDLPVPHLEDGHSGQDHPSENQASENHQAEDDHHAEDHQPEEDQPA